MRWQIIKDDISTEYTNIQPHQSIWYSFKLQQNLMSAVVAVGAAKELMFISNIGLIIDLHEDDITLATLTSSNKDAFCKAILDFAAAHQADTAYRLDKTIEQELRALNIFDISNRLHKLEKLVATNYSGYNELHMAVLTSDVEMVIQLINNNADLDLEAKTNDYDSKTALEIITQNFANGVDCQAALDIANLLLEKGALPYKENTDEYQEEFLHHKIDIPYLVTSYDHAYSHAIFKNITNNTLLGNLTARYVALLLHYGAPTIEFKGYLEAMRQGNRILIN